MQIEKYIKGDRHGKEANRLEREAMNDPFLQDALDGFDAVPGNHAEIIERLSLKIQGSQNYSLATPENGQTLADTNVKQQNDQLNSERTLTLTPSSPSSPLSPSSTSSTPSTSSPPSPLSPSSTSSTPSTSFPPSPLSPSSTSSTPSTSSPPSPLSTPIIFSIAATILLLIGFGTYFLLKRNDPYLSAFMTLQTKEEEIEITPEYPLLPSESAKESDAQTMEKITESENTDRAALAKSAQAVTSQQESAPAARANIPANTQELSAQKESRSAAPTTPSQTGVTTQKSLVERQKVSSADRPAVSSIDSNKAAVVKFEQTYIAEVTDNELEEDAMFFLLDSNETVKRKAQESETFTFSGKVVDESGDPLPGVNITNKSTTTSATTDSNGTFTIQLTENDPKKLTVSYIGFVSKEIDLSDTNRIITLEEDAQLLSEVVVVGYGIQKKNILTGASSKTENSATRIASNEKFGEKEFQEYCRQKADKNACDGKKVTVRVSFFIDASGKPTQIKYDRFTCEKAKEEIALLLSASPVWTNANRKVTMTIRW